ncbi:2',3'-cyclic-nucleotide 2'-phosphodiesterase/3'-nucleotidase [Nocardiopsis arvandica]|uniref:2',3'-cyclic-nucleotide 2'-phosphodiesterase/3'-nucleotidase n=1 Tax=Nocardiopsis sinuspersici TaxID=501010 RepID=A0A7Z0BLF1_9ACTN|nr:5'-nucleotidase C-terminal domain-containing protein [Nocardiopsis sinuspersici]NYH55186.1 2',3'-cyclic-nucleotide 2'-phosphodiesterase/3'-nucleotidase [Nocardiopsis sinuspersici]
MSADPGISRRGALGGLSAAGALALAGWPGTAAASSARDALITVMGTSDLHGHCLNWDYFKDAEFEDGEGNHIGIAKAASLIKEVRAERGRNNTLLFDSGDTIQGAPLATYYNVVEPITETGQTHPMARAMNAVGYDAVALGNHEFNYGLEHLDTWIDQMQAPVLAANALHHGTDEPAYRPYVLKRMKVDCLDKPGTQPLVVGVLGLTNPGSIIWDRHNVEGELEFADLVESARHWVPVMRGEGADLVIVSAHSGDSGTSSYGGGVPVENASAMVAEEVPGIDAILFGHAHRDISERFVTNKVTGEQVLMTMPSYWGRRLSVMDLALRRERGRWRVTSKSAVTLNSNTVEEDPEIVELVADQHATAVEYVNQVVATSVEELSAAQACWRDTAIVDYIQHVQIETVRAAIQDTAEAALPVLSIAAPFSRSAVFPAGDVSIRDIAGLYVYDNTLLAGVLTGAQLRDYLEYSARYFHRVSASGAVDPGGLTNAGGTPDYNFDQVAGLEYDIDVSRPVGGRITSLTLQGAKVADDQRFVLAVNNYRQSGGGGFPHITGAPVVYNAQVQVRQALIDYATATGTIDPADFHVVNWRLVREGTPVFD